MYGGKHDSTVLSLTLKYFANTHAAEDISIAISIAILRPFFDYFLTWKHPIAISTATFVTKSCCYSYCRPRDANARAPDALTYYASQSWSRFWSHQLCDHIAQTFAHSD
jgi:hypothetical protein